MDEKNTHRGGQTDGRTDKTKMQYHHNELTAAKASENYFRTDRMSHGRADESDTYDGINAANNRRTEADCQKKFLATSQQQLLAAGAYLFVHVAGHNLNRDNKSD